jgi:hypothetical protein
MCRQLSVTNVFRDVTGAHCGGTASLLSRWKRLLPVTLDDDDGVTVIDDGDSGVARHVDVVVGGLKRSSAR